jgi:coenzyme Q-binding protein COQ10
MPAHSQQQFLPYTPRQVFDLVADIERYPEFLPWCRAARILERAHGECLAELMVSFNHLSERYTSRVVFTPPTGSGEGAIEVTLVKGPFEHLVNRWKFVPENGGTQVDFFLDFKFRSRILEKLMGGFFSKATNKMVTAFRQRADTLYGSPAS